jgi:DNA-binding response OmpR family regulator
MISRANPVPDSGAQHDSRDDQRREPGRVGQFPKAILTEDSHGVCEALRVALLARGGRVEVVRTGRELERALECDGPYRLVVSTAQLPEKTGLGVLAKARAQRVAAPFIVVIGMHGDRTRVMISDPQSDALSSRMLSGPDLAAVAVSFLWRDTFPAA